MSEHDDSYARHDLPTTTGEFRAAPDLSASTAEFKAFVSSQDRGPDENGTGGAWPEQPWAGETTGSGSKRPVILAVGAIVVVAIILAIFLAVG
ncbi:MAG TPA: hypothetical protein VMU94_10060 [Streptosporangiaceae bacterium]|nr:hypothetical protein [Streptosporangiaceae bacterium]